MPLPKNVLVRAVDRLKAQGLTPYSPCDFDKDNQIRLCAAAAVAAYGIEMADGPTARDAFEKSLAANRDSESVRASFRRLGWDVRDCERIFAYNNSLPDEKRQAGVVTLLNSQISHS